MQEAKNRGVWDQKGCFFTRLVACHYLSQPSHFFKAELPRGVEGKTSEHGNGVLRKMSPS